MRLNKVTISLLVFIMSFSCEDLYNQGNEISEITANVDSVKAGLVVYLKCLATDENNDELSYHFLKEYILSLVLYRINMVHLLLKVKE